jgi:hypothetical protein
MVEPVSVAFTQSCLTDRLAPANLAAWWERRVGENELLPPHERGNNSAGLDLAIWITARRSAWD